MRFCNVFMAAALNHPAPIMIYHCNHVHPVLKSKSNMGSSFGYGASKHGVPRAPETLLNIGGSVVSGERQTVKIYKKPLFVICEALIRLRQKGRDSLNNPATVLLSVRSRG